MRNTAVGFWKPLLFTALWAVIAVALIPFRREVAGVVVRVGAYIVWSLNLAGRVIPQQVLWFFLLVVFLYVAVGSFYGKRLNEKSARNDTSPIIGSVEAVTQWIEAGQRGTYSKWQIANLLGKIHQRNVENGSGGTTSQAALPSQQVQSYLDAGTSTSYVDYPSPGLFQKRSPTPFDIPLEQVVDYLEDQMEIKHAR